MALHACSQLVIATFLHEHSLHEEIVQEWNGKLIVLDTAEHLHLEEVLRSILRTNRSLLSTEWVAVDTEYETEYNEEKELHGAVFYCCQIFMTVTTSFAFIYLS